MRISSRGQYGLRALTVLALRHGNGPVQVREIARAERLSAKYLEQLLGRLRTGGLVKSVRGARGGYTLARLPKAITVREALVLLEGSLAPVSCVGAPGQSGTPHEATDCPSHSLWEGLHHTVLSYLDSFTLADLVERLQAEGGDAAHSATDHRSNEAAPDDALAPAGARG